ncbi:hypothetical protein LTR56_015129 [Elasticomyces elasticus]|nr:hypothetical protein LTR56_015129 [Elasticomyces elasticus]KAK3651971.1 hypothetical protein LTR22_011901 [Elasticomyces elasticus]KAK4919076.1 hypothetical protein LTR49_013247 [Elasticomyces elasticus]KAK5765692.1 hypothetical protein LTS12_004198 [Elasticomyces elasticus]
MTDQQTNLRTLSRFITTHNAQGKSVVSTQLPTQVPKTSVQNGAAYHASPYSTSQFPVDLNNNADLDAYTNYLTSSPGLVNTTGTVVHIAEFSPGFQSAMHRTVSLDLVVVLEVVPFAISDVWLMARRGRVYLGDGHGKPELRFISWFAIVRTVSYGRRELDRLPSMLGRKMQEQWRIETSDVVHGAKLEEAAEALGFVQMADRFDVSNSIELD